MDSSKLICSLVFDEMSIKRYVEFDKTEDIVIGLEDDGVVRNNVFATTVLVVMIRGVHANYKLPVSYYGTHSSTNGCKLKSIIISTIRNLASIGFTVAYTICDQGSNNINAYSLLGVTADKPYFYVDEKKMYGLYDVPHLLKSFRNNLLLKNIQTENGSASWQDIEKVYEIDQTSIRARLLPNLSRSHLQPTLFQKMKVSLAAKVLSRTTAAGLATAYNCHNLKTNTILSTIEYIEKCNDCFDILNCRSTNFKYCLTSDNHEVFLKLNEYKIYVNTIANLNSNHIHCFRGIVQTINAIVDSFRSNQYSYLLTYRLNQDCLKNFFNSVRTLGGNNRNPTLKRFADIFGHLLFSKLCGEISEYGNCSQDSDINLLQTSNAVTIENNDLNNTNISIETNALLPTDALNSNANDVINHVHMEHDYCKSIECGSAHSILEENAIRYEAGYITKMVNKKFNCNNCYRLFVNENKVLNENEIYIHLKAYEVHNDNPFGKLHVPSDYFYKITSLTLDVFQNEFVHNLHGLDLV